MLKTNRQIPYYMYIVIALACFILQVEALPIMAQQKGQVPVKELPKALQRRQRARVNQEQLISAIPTDSLSNQQTTEIIQEPVTQAPADSVTTDSIARLNAENMVETEAPIDTSLLIQNLPSVEHTEQFESKKVFIPDPAKATWLAVIFPGGGQIYNRKYWKLPIVYGGFVGCAYALTWNGQMYDDYSQAYLDIMDDNPNTDSFLDLLPPGYNVEANMDYLKKVIKRKKDSYRRYRDLRIFCVIGVYIVSIIDAYVDAELANFDISKDLSMKICPPVINNNELDLKQGNSYGVKFSLNF